MKQQEPRKKALYERKAPATKGNWRGMLKLGIGSGCVMSRHQMTAEDSKTRLGSTEATD